MTLIVILNAFLAILIIGVIVALHSHAIVTEHRQRRRRATLWAVSELSGSEEPRYWPERRAA
jgi:hypothetical protein